MYKGYSLWDTYYASSIQYVQLGTLHAGLKIYIFFTFVQNNSNILASFAHFCYLNINKLYIFKNMLCTYFFQEPRFAWGLSFFLQKLNFKNVKPS